MWTDIVILLVTTMLAGLAVLAVPRVNTKFYSLALVFAGAYLFSITIMHILPELFSKEGNKTMIAFWVLVGFFLQVILEFFTEGVEHGHLHQHQHAHKHVSTGSLSLLLALFLHAFLEGTLLAHPTTIHDHHESGTLLAGIIMHKMPAAFALMSVLTCHFNERWKSIALLSVFALASPLGLFLSDYLYSLSLISEQNFVILFAIVSGNFLHISTTIFFESSPDHHFHSRKLIVSFLGAGVAVAAELLF
jgi:zinc and cadmium transporter